MAKPVGKTELAVMATVARFDRPVTAYEVGIFTHRIATTDRAKELLDMLEWRGWVEVVGPEYRATDLGRAAVS